MTAILRICLLTVIDMIVYEYRLEGYTGVRSVRNVTE